MKNKKLTYFLGVLVIGVWGLIIYRVFRAMGGDDNPNAQVMTAFKKEAFNDYELPKDTGKLLLNYRDPFSVEKEKDTARTPVIKPVRPAMPKPAVNWGMIKYAGFVHNPGSGKIIAIVSINGRQQMLAEGETADQVRLLRNMKDSIQVLYQGNTKFITMNARGQ